MTVPRRWRCSAVVVVLTAVAALCGSPAAAATPQKPEKISAGVPTYRPSLHAFEVPLSARGVPREPVFRLETTLEVRGADGAMLARRGPQVDLARWAEGARPDDQGYVDLVTVEVVWHRNGGTVSGPVELTGVVRLVHMTGRVADETSFVATVEVSGPSTG